MVENNIFIEVLKFGAQKELTGCNFNELADVVLKEKTEINYSLLKDVFDECFELSVRNLSSNKYILKTEYYFRLLDYEELQQAKQASRESNRNALLAIIVSLFAIGLGIWTSFRPVSINAEDIRVLTQSNIPPQVQKVHLEQKYIKLEKGQLTKILSLLNKQLSSINKLHIEDNSIQNKNSMTSPTQQRNTEKNDRNESLKSFVVNGDPTGNLPRVSGVRAPGNKDLER